MTKRSANTVSRGNLTWHNFLHSYQDSYIVIENFQISINLTWRLYRDNGLIKLFPFAVIARPADAGRTGKNSAIPGGPPGLFPAQLPGQSIGGVRQVTQTPSTAVPLAFMWRSLIGSQITYIMTNT